MSVFTSLAAFFLAFASYILVKFIIVPLWKMSYYKKQGISCYFFPFLGPMKRGRGYAKKFNDNMAFSRELAKIDPDFKLEVINSGSEIGVVLFDAKFVREFFAKQSHYQKSPFTKDLTTLLGTGLVVAEGNTWKSHRRIISSVFHFEFIKQNIPLIVSTTREYLQELAKSQLKNVDIMEEIQKITGEVVGRIFFGKRLNDYTLKGEQLTVYLARLVSRCAFNAKGALTLFLFFLGVNSDWVPENKKHLNDIKEFRSLCLKIIQDRKASKVKVHDMLGLLLETQSSANVEDRFSDEDIVNEFVTFFIAGMDTTGHVITMVLYLLDRNPEYKAKVEEEVKQIYKTTDPVSVETISQMEMTHAVIKETLRLYTPVPTFFPRQAIEDHNLLDVKIKKGMSVRVRPLFNFSNGKYFENPEQFKPERWFNKREQALDGFVDIPFSAGARNCIGQHLAMIESKIILAEFMKMFSFKVTPEDYKLVMSFNFLYEPKFKIQMELNPKENY